MNFTKNSNWSPKEDATKSTFSNSLSKLNNSLEDYLTLLNRTKELREDKSA